MQGDSNPVIVEHGIVFDVDLLFLVGIVQSVENEANLGCRTRRAEAVQQG